MAISSKDIVNIVVSLVLIGILMPIGIGLVSAFGQQTVSISGTPEITKVEFQNFANTNGNDTLHFTIVNNAGSDEEHYIWFANDSYDADPSESGTAHKVNITDDITDNDIRDSVYETLNALNIEAEFTKLLGAWLEIKNINDGDVADANQEGTSINTITIALQGRDLTDTQLLDITDQNILTLISVLIPVLAVIGIALKYIPKKK
jgi:hypothetical protein